MAEPKEKVEYGLNRVELRGIIGSVTANNVGDYGLYVVNALLSVPGQKSVQIVPVEALEAVGRRIAMYDGQRVFLEGRIEAREHQGRWYPKVKIYEVWGDTLKIQSQIAEAKKEFAPGRSVEEANAGLPPGEEVPF